MGEKLRFRGVLKSIESVDCGGINKLVRIEIYISRRDLVEGCSLEFDMTSLIVDNPVCDFTIEKTGKVELSESG